MISPGGETVVTSGDDGTLRLWNPENGAVDKIAPDMVLHSPRTAVTVAFAPDGKRSPPAGLIRSRFGTSPTASTRPRSNAARAILHDRLLARAEPAWPLPAAIGPSCFGTSPRKRVTAATAQWAHRFGEFHRFLEATGKLMISGSDDGWSACGIRRLPANKPRSSGHAAAVLSTALSPDGMLRGIRKRGPFDPAVGRRSKKIAGDMGRPPGCGRRGGLFS